MFDGSLGGRAETCATILDALEAGWSVTVHGAPGVGKSAIARQVEGAWVRAGRAVVTLVLEEPIPSEELEARLGAALGASSPATHPGAWAAAMAKFFDVPGLLLSLDGPGVFGSADALETLLAGAPSLRLVCCSPRAFGWAVERAVRVAPLSLEDATRLFGVLVRRRGAEPSAESVEAIVESAGGLPLALELLAGRFVMLGRKAIESELVMGSSGAALDRSMGRVVDALSPEEREALLRLSLVRGALDVALATLIIGQGQALRKLERLVEASLIHRSVVDGVYVVLDSIKAFVVSRASPEALETARAHHAAVFAEPMPVRPQSLGAFSALGARRDDLLTAWRWTVTRAEQNDLTATAWALELARTLDSVLLTQGPATLHFDVLTRSCSLAGGTSTGVARDLLLALGRAEAFRGHFGAASLCFEAVRVQAEAVSDQSRLGWACAFSAYVERALGHFDTASRAATQALGLARQLKDFPMAAMAEISLGHLAQARGHLDAAARAFRRVLAIADITGAARIEGIGSGSLGAVAIEAGRLDEAAQALTRARRAFESVDDRSHLARVVVDEARLAMHRGDPGATASLLAAIEHARLAGSLEGELYAREAAVLLARREGDAALAEERLTSLEALVAMGDNWEWATRVARLRAGEGSLLQLSPDGRTVRFDDTHIDFSRRGPLRRVLLALARAFEEGRRLSSDELRNAGWPGERMLPSSASARVYMAVRRLRALGLENTIVTHDDGYGLAARVRLEWTEHEVRSDRTAAPAKPAAHT
ncbi:MAG: hypothetical protein Q8L14_33160 [Myxococcales bacterium]|nr:hypothetical protein [Myxococcales bacterium]